MTNACITDKNSKRDILWVAGQPNIEYIAVERTDMK